MSERAKNILGVMVFLIIMVAGIILIDARIGEQNAEVENTPTYYEISNK